jgi:DNA-binding transcriptional MerR regulator
MTSGAFAALCGATKETLRHYKDLGLLLPAHRGENGYFYYDAEQFYDFYAIAIFRQTGTPLAEIRRCLGRQDAGETLDLLRVQREALEEERRRLEQMDFVLSGMIRNLELGGAPDLEPRRAWFPREHLLALPAEELGRIEPAPEAGDDVLIAVLERCRELCGRYGLQPDYQLGAIHSPDTEQSGVRYLYTRIKEAADCPYYREKPAGNYLYLCCRGRWDISEGYEALSRYVKEEGIRTAGPVYACDLAGFILNGVERNAVSMISVGLAEKEGA